MLEPVALGWLSAPDFKRAVASLPLVSIDVYLCSPDGRLLLGWRRHAPARHCWFTPGGRIRKGEALGMAYQRVWQQELAWPSSAAVPEGQWLGVWDHFYDDSALDENTGTHYVNLAYAVALDEATLANCQWPSGEAHQHDRWCWMPADEVAHAAEVHPHVQRTVTEALLPWSRRMASV
jgi:colanic acid biosynthesis protein WcaH